MSGATAKHFERECIVNLSEGFTRQICVNIVLSSLSSRTLFSLLSSPHSVSYHKTDQHCPFISLKSYFILPSQFSRNLYHTTRQINIVLLSLSSRTLFFFLSSPHFLPYNKTDQHCPFISLKSYFILPSQFPALSTIQQDRSTLSFYLSQVVLIDRSYTCMENISTIFNTDIKIGQKRTFPKLPPCRPSLGNCTMFDCTVLAKCK